MTDAAVITFEGELIGLLHRDWPDGVVPYPVTRKASLKDVIEALGPPHTEVYGLQENGVEVGFEQALEPGHNIVVSPACFPIDPTRSSVLRPMAFSRLAFACDANVGRLARLLRLLGFDCSFSRDITDAKLAELGERENRVVLSRDRGCLKRSRIIHGRLVRANDPTTQVSDILTAYGLWPRIRPFTRCLGCNTALSPVAKAEVLALLEPKTKKYYDVFWRCPDCQQVYWAGSHHDGMLRLIARLQANAGISSAPCPDTGPDAIGRSAGPGCR